MTNEQIIKLIEAAEFREEAAGLIAKAVRIENEALGIIKKPYLKLVK